MSPTDLASTLPYVAAIGIPASDVEHLAPLLGRLPPTSQVAYLVASDGAAEAHRQALARLRELVKLPLVEVGEEEVALEAGRIYVPGDGRDLRFDNGMVKGVARQLLAPQFAFDTLLIALADSVRERCIAIVPATIATHAYRGMRAVKENGGLVVLERTPAVDPAEDPDRALAVAIADLVLEPGEMAHELAVFTDRAAHRRIGPLEGGDELPEPGADLARVVELISERTGVDFGDYKTSTVLRRIERRMAISGVDSLAAYADLLARSQVEAGILYHEFLIGVTRFFRDAEAFETLRERVIKPLLLSGDAREPLRVWVAGCATGEEAYTVGILMQEAMIELDRRRAVKIFATDLDRDAVQFASAGSYPESIAADVPKPYLERWFTRKGDRFVVNKPLRELVVLAPHNIQKDPPFYKIDLITCRNLLIYLQPALQRRLFTTFHFALNPEGYLMLGTCETLGEMAQFFTAVEAKLKLYQKLGSKKAPPITEGLFSGHHRHLTPALSFAGGKKEGPPNLSEELEQAVNSALLREYMPTFLVVGENFEIAHVFGEMGSYLKLPVGRPTLNVLKMAPRELAVALGTAIRRALKEGKPVVYDAIEFRDDRGSINRLRLTVKPFPLHKALGNYVAVVFEEEAPARQPAAPAQHFDIESQSEQRIHDLELEVQQTSESLQAAIEELETANEELQATNEEVLAANEELQSTNEELQSVNEELYTVNAEHQAKITELTELNNDILNFLASTNIGTVFLDQRLCVRKFTPAATAQINLMDRDIGRPLEHISNYLKYGNLVADAAEVLRTLVPIQREVMTRDGRWYLMRLLPYRTEDNVIKGVVLTFIDISEVKTASESIRRLTMMVENSTSIAMITDASGAIEYVNRRFVDVTGWSADEAMGRNPRFMRADDADAEALKGMWATISGGDKWQGRFVNRDKRGGTYVEEAVVIPMQDAEGKIVNYLKIAEVREGEAARLVEGRR